MKKIDIVAFILIVAMVVAGVVVVGGVASKLVDRDHSNLITEETNFIIDQFNDEIEISQPYEDPQESEKIDAALDWHYIEDVTLTAYCSCAECCGKDDGITATGTQAQQGVTIAVDPDVIPLGAWVEIDGHQYHAEDVGGCVNGNHIDVYFDSHDEAVEFGRQVANVQWYGGLENEQ